MTTPAAPRFAATVVVVRDAPDGLEVLMLRRTQSRDHTSGAWVFPGGLLDPNDGRCHRLCVGIDDREASAKLDLDDGGLDYYVAAIRECFEEAGILFAVDAGGQPIDMLVDVGTRLAQQRGPLHRGETSIADICEAEGLRLAAGELHYIAHWITPPGRIKRFDTRFFLAVLPAGQSSAHDALETVDHAWLRPADALARASELNLLTPQRSLLATVGRHQHTDSLLAWARSPREIATVAPRLAMSSKGVQTIQPHEPAWAEVGLIDPDGQGTAWCELRPGLAVRLSPQVMRVTSDSGWNTYLVGDAGGCTVIDAGPQDERHLAAVIAAAPGRIERIVSTDAAHSPGASTLAARSGAALHELREGENLRIADAATLHALAPRAGAGTAQRMFLLVEAQLVFTGQVDAAAWPAAHDGIAWIAPAQGFLRSAARRQQAG
jgi:8-oxo-dGTP pyrophosphatase MutT (NUDIX family)